MHSASSQVNGTIEYCLIGCDCLLHSEGHEFAVNPLSPFEEVHPFDWRMKKITNPQSHFNQTMTFLTDPDPFQPLLLELNTTFPISR